MAWKYRWVQVPWSTVGLRSQAWGSVGAVPQSEDMDSYGTEELNRQDKNEYGSKAKTWSAQVKIRVLSFKAASRRSMGGRGYISAV